MKPSTNAGALPFAIAIEDSALNDLERRLDAVRWPDRVLGTGWDYGTDVDFAKDLVEYWRSSYDWRIHERRINESPQFKADIDEQTLHFVHRKGTGKDPLPLLLLHGWPSSFFEFERLVDLLTTPDPGGDGTDSFDVVVLSLPGFGFSSHPTQPGVNVERIAKWAHRLMTDTLGYERYAAHGGDWGGMVASYLGYAQPQELAGIHLNMAGATPHPANRKNTTQAEERWLRVMDHWRRTELGYLEIQATKPQTLGYGLNDSPVGLCAWITEKFRTWSDCGGDVTQVCSFDQLLTNVMIYWFTQTITSSCRLYYEHRKHPWFLGEDESIAVPTAIAEFPKEIVRPPMEWAERSYSNIVRWTEMPKGGHFPALEQPDLLAQDIRSFCQQIRS